MRVEGHKKLIRQMEQLPDTTKDHIRRAIRRNLDAGERIALTLAPDVTYETKGNIYTVTARDGMGGEIRAIPSDAPQKDKDRAYSVEWGRKKGTRGTTVGYSFIWATRQYMEKRFRNSIKAAIRKAVKEATNG